jgi:hypothetical protein
MKRLLGMVLLSAAATLWFWSAAPGSADHATVTAYPLQKAQVCYDVDQGEDVKIDVVLDTKTYEKDEVQVRRLVMMCELSTISTFKIPMGPFLWIPHNPPTVSDTSIFACYTLRGGDDAGMGAILKTPSFGEDKVIVGTSNLMCESAKKHVINPDGTKSTYGVGTNTIWQCFKIGNSDIAPLAASFANNNFGADVVTTGKGIELCEEGVKYREINGQIEVTGFANGVAHECFEVTGWQEDEKLPVVLETENFGRDEVVVRKATQICQLAEKGDFHIVQVSPVRP